MSVKVHEAFSIDSFQDRLLWWDDFLGDQLKDEWRSGGSGSAVVVDAQTGGIVRLTTGATTNNFHYIEWVNIRSLLASKKVSMETRQKWTQTANTRVLIRIMFDGANYVGFFLSQNTAIYRIYCVNGGGTTLANIAYIPDTNYHIYRIECHTHGGSHAHFYIDGAEVAGSPITTNVPANHLQPYLVAWTEEDAVKSIDIDYVVIRQEI